MANMATMGWYAAMAQQGKGGESRSRVRERDVCVTLHMLHAPCFYANACVLHTYILLYTFVLWHS